jgi:hypothetical protein
MTLTRDQAQHILKQAKVAKLCTDQYRAAKHALRRNDLEAFERVCRAIHAWLAMHGIDYTLTDGLAEEFYYEGTLSSRYTYKDGVREGLAEWFYPEGEPAARCTYKDGMREGLAEDFYPDGTLEYRCTYKNGILQ